MSDIHVCWEWPVESNPAQLWPLISDTDRFNADSGVPAIEQIGQSQFRRQLKLSRFGVTVEWEEEPFEWVRPERFGVVRRYRSGPLVEMRVLAELLANPSRLRYQVWAKARSFPAGLLVRMQLFESGRRFARTVRNYDAAAQRPGPYAARMPAPTLSESALNRIERARRKLIADRVDEDLMARLANFIRTAPDHDVYRMRPYALADEWGAERREVLELLLRATSAGLLEFQWELLCPLCRGAKQREAELMSVDPHAHCGACNVDFRADFDRSVELTFRPHTEVREATLAEYCVGGPQNTPHIVMQQILEALSRRSVRLVLEPGMYRFRGWGEERGRMLRAGAVAASNPVVLDGTPGPEMPIAANAEVILENPADETRVAILERVSWSDQAATAADVTALQLFRTSFAGEAPGADTRFSVASLTALFTDLENATALYGELGDGRAFTVILRHQELLARAVEDNGGALVKTMGDRSMAVFRRPLGAVRAALQAQRALASPAAPLRLQAGIHTGPSIVVTLNDRLDYFGAAVNLAASLAALSQGDDIVATGAVWDDPEVAGWLSAEAAVPELLPAAHTRWGDPPPAVFRLRSSAIRRIHPGSRSVQASVRDYESSR